MNIKGGVAMKRLDKRRVEAAPLDGWMRTGIIAGLIGGLAEVTFMSVYCLITGRDGLEILNLITLTFFKSDGEYGFLQGVFIHLGLSAAIGASFSAFMWAVNYKTGLTMRPWDVAPAPLILIAIWVFNFFILLPKINPAFIQSVPVYAAFFSKLSFGLTLRAYWRRRYLCMGR